MCMSVRGVEKPGSSTITTQFTGSFRDSADDQVRFITMVRGPIAKASPRIARGIDWLTIRLCLPAAGSAEEVEEGLAFAPKFDADGLIACRGD